MPRWFVLFLLGLAVLAAPAAAAGPYMIADLNTARADFEAAALPGASSVELDGFLYFVADDGLHGGEVWRTDGTGEGTELVSDVCPGPCSSWSSSLTVFGDRIGFRASDGLHGVELWVSDGTREGTRMPRDLCPGSCSSWADGLTAAGDRLFFVTHSTQGGHLAVTDGTAAGTRILVSTERNRPPRLIGEIQGRLAFLVSSADQSTALWWSDGTPEGTSPALDLCSTSLGCSNSGFWERPVVVGDRIVFWVRAYEPNPEIWASDGTASGTRKIGNTLLPDPGAALWKGSLYFSTFDSLWQTDGTPEGTRRLRSFSGGDRPPHHLLPFGNVLLFVTGGWFGHRATIWQSLGTPGSTTPMIDPVPNDPAAQVGPLTRVGNRVYFSVAWETRSEIWETDGTASGTRRRAHLCGGGGQSIPNCQPHQTAPSFPASIQGRYLFGLAEGTYGFELWTLGAAGPRLVRDIHRNAGSSRVRLAGFSEVRPAPARDVAALGSRLVFSARTIPGENASLWASDGTAAGTLEIGPDISWPQGLVQIGDRLWLRGSYSPPPALEGRGLWTTDGTAAGTVRLAPDEIGFRGLPGGRPGLVLAGADEWQVGQEPWVSDGTPGGTRLLKDINLQREPLLFPGDGDMPGSSRPADFAPIGTSVLFAADDGLELGREPWITDGTAAGTRLLLDINLTVTAGGTGVGSSPGPFVRFGDRTFFAADDGVSGRELWSTDGTAAGTVRVRDLRPGAASSNPRDLVTMGARLFFLANDGPSDALWTVSSTGQATKVRILRGGRRAAGLMAAGNRLFFVVDSAATGPELWTSDGTRQGTRMAREIRPGVLGSYPQELTAVGGLLLFAADDGRHGLEPWVSDGTAAGTRLLADLAPGVDASAPANFSVTGDLVGFDADDGVHGREMWAVRKGDLTP